MQDLPVLFAIAGFTVMGIGEIAKPAFVTAQLGILALTQAGRNEVRAVYAVFGLFISLALLDALRHAASVQRSTLQQFNQPKGET
jgi:hypothetical protein